MAPVSRLRNPKRAGEMGSKGAFACASGPVDGDDGALAFFGFRLRWRLSESLRSAASSGLFAS